MKIFKRLFSKKLLIYMNIGTSFTLAGIGDVFEQHYEIMKKEIHSWNPIRTTNMSISGSTNGLIYHYWYHYLEAKLPGRSVGSIFKKILADQLICSPFAIFVFMATLCVLESKSIYKHFEEVKRNAIQLYVAESLIWPIAQCFNFYLLPVKYRVIYDSFVSLGYDIYVSHIVQRKNTKDL